MVTEAGVKPPETAANHADGLDTTALQVIDDIDSRQIVQGLEGRAVSEWAYSLDKGGVTGLTVSGVQAAARQMGSQGEVLRVMDVKTDTSHPDFVLAHVVVGRYLVSAQRPEGILMDTALGSKREMYKKWGRNVGYYNDEHAFEKAVSKAERNAKNKMLDDQVRARTLAMALAAPSATHVVDEVEHKAASREVNRNNEAPPDDKAIAEKKARQVFWAAVEDKGWAESEVHLRLGLTCQSGKRHDCERDDPERCHALREYIKGTRRTPADVWRDLTRAVSQGLTVSDI